MTYTENNVQDYSGWVGQNVLDAAGEKIGKVSQIYVDDQSGQPEWLAINTGLFKTRSSFVPLAGAKADGDQLVISYDKATVKDAPQVDDGDGFLAPAEEEELYRYYGQSYTATTDTPVHNDTPVQSNGYDTSGPTTDEAMTRSEEQIRVGTAKQESGRVRLRKYVVTENVQTTVPVSHEEVRIEREPITDANRGAALSGADISEEEHEIILTEERPVVQKEVVPVERVKLSKDTVTDEEVVSEQVRKEQIETEGAEKVAER